MFENYKGKIVHFIGGINEYIGEIDTSKHPNGKGWVRLLNPCFYSVQKQGKNFLVGVMRIWGIEKTYEHYVDLYIPHDSMVEIKVLDNTGQLYDQYRNELSKPSLNKIIAPTAADMNRVTPFPRQ